MNHSPVLIAIGVAFFGIGTIWLGCEFTFGSFDKSGQDIGNALAKPDASREEQARARDRSMEISRREVSVLRRFRWLAVALVVLGVVLAVV